MSDATSPWLSISEILAGIETGDFGALDLVESALSRSNALDPRLRAWSHLWPERARKRAEQLDALPARHRGALHGVPIAVKDLCDVRGEPTDAGTVVLGDRPATEDATVVHRLEEAGAVILGKLKMTEGALSAHHPSVEPPVNPWKADRWTGISSSGSGVAVAGGLCTAALGTDTGGSIRFPSSACGIVGLKPTHGRASLAGVYPLAPSLDHIGPMARSVDDVARLFGVMAGPDPRDPTTLRVPPPAFESPGTVAGLRIGFDRAYCETDVDPEIASAVGQVRGALESAGAHVCDVEIPPVETLLAAWLPICAAEVANAHAKTFPVQRDQYGDDLARMIDLGRSLTGQAVADAWHHRTAYTRQMAAVFEACDVFVCPGLAVRFAANANLGDDPPPDGATAAMRFTLPFNLTGNPSLTLPCGMDDEGAPIGVQLVGPSLSEARLLGLGGGLEASGVCRTRHPELALS